MDPYNPSEVVERFASHASRVLAGHAGNEAYIRIADAFRDLNHLFLMHAVMIVRESPPALIVDAKGRTWALVKVVYTRGRSNPRARLKNRAVYRRLR